MKENIFVFEYQEPSQKHGMDCNTHYNTSFQNGHFRQPIGSSGYYPVAILPFDICSNPKWDAFIRKIWAEKPTYERVVVMTYTWIFENCPEWHITFDKDEQN
ncbi:MAG: hypothetical protein IKH15_09215 [Bacteroidales bacterium]|nr:hypothetical protein [Bacteroidales bacterium]